MDWKTTCIMIAVLVFGALALLAAHDNTLAGTALGGVLGFIMQSAANARAQADAARSSSTSAPTLKLGGFLPLIGAGVGLATALTLGGCGTPAGQALTAANASCDRPAIAGTIDAGAELALAEVDGALAHTGDAAAAAVTAAGGLLSHVGLPYAICIVEHLLSHAPSEVAGPAMASSRCSHRPVTRSHRAVLLELRHILSDRAAHERRRADWITTPLDGGDHDAGVPR